MLYDKVPFQITKPLTILFISYYTVVISYLYLCVVSALPSYPGVYRENSMTHISFDSGKGNLKFDLLWRIQFSIFQVESTCFHVKSASSRRIAVHLTARPLVVRALGRKRFVSFSLFSFGVTFTHFFKAYTHKCGGTKARPLSWRALFEKPFSAFFPEKIWPSLVPRQLSPPTEDKNNRKI